MKTIFNSRHFFIIAGICFSVAMLGQPAQLGSSSQQASVNIDFFAIDRKDNPIADIRQADLMVLDGKEPARSIVSLKMGGELPLTRLIHEG